MTMSEKKKAENPKRIENSDSLILKSHFSDSAKAGIEIQKVGLKSLKMIG